MKKLSGRLLIAVFTVIVLLSSTGFAEVYNLTETIKFLGSSSTTNLGLSQPRDVAFDNSGNMYVASYGNSRIFKRDTSGNWTTFGSSIGNPRKIVYYGGYIYVIDNTYNVKYAYVNATYPSWTTLNISNKLYIGSIMSFAVSSTLPAKFYVGTTKGVYQLNAVSTGYTAVQLLALTSGIDGIAVDSFNHVYASTQGQIWSSYDPVDAINKWVKLTSVAYSSDLAIDSSNNIYVTVTGSDSSVQKFSAVAVLLAKMGNYTASRNPSGLTVYPGSSNVYAACSDMNAITVFKPMKIFTPLPR